MIERPWIAGALLFLALLPVGAADLFDAASQVARVADGFGFAEGVVANARGDVFFTDIPNSRIYVWSADGRLSVFRERSAHANGLRFDRSGNLLACEGAGRRVTSQAPGGTPKVVCDRYDGKRFNSPNDLWVDPHGGVYFTDPRYSGAQWIWEERSSLTNRVDDPDDAEEQGAHGLYYLPSDGKPVRRCAAQFTQPNGVIGTLDGKWLYVSDTEEKKVRRFAIRADGSLADETVFIPSYSDGMTLDELGNLYLTNGGVDIYTPEGKRIATIPVPEKAANVGFGGVDHRTLFIAARRGLYAIRMNVRGQ